MDARRKSLWLFVLGGLLVAIGLAFFVSPYASGSPDGLNKVAEDKGFDGSAQEHALEESPLAGYEVKGIDDPRLSKGISGIIGVAMTFGIGMILFGMLVRRHDRMPVVPTDTGGATTARSVT